jgi:3-deoxy-manno-octulosonate cytidylyltransferase (CMP-KDO synthetase)
MKIIAFIPARYDSTRFPGKPLALIAGKPMIRHVYRCALSCPDISDVFVATDNERIFRCVQEFGGKAIMTGQKHPSGTDRVAEAAQKINLKMDDIIINIQGDQPLFKPSPISQMIAPLLEDRDLPMSTLMYRITDELEVQHPDVVKLVTDNEGFALYFSRSPIPFFRDADSDQTHYKHLGFYGYRMEFLTTFAGLPVGRLESAEKLEPLRFLEYGYRIKVVESQHDSIEIDKEKDIEKVEHRLAESNPATDKV